MKRLGILLFLSAIFSIVSCDDKTITYISSFDSTDVESGNEPMRELEVLISDEKVETEFEDNESVTALMQLIEDNNGLLEITLNEYGGFEAVGDLPSSLPRNDTHITAVPGDIILYQGRSISFMYGDNTWNYTRLGRITDKTAFELEELLAHDSVIVSFSLRNQ